MGALQEAIDDRLTPDARAALDRHLEACGRCRNELRALRAVKDRLGRLRTDDDVSELVARLGRAIDEDAGPVTGARGPRWPKGWIAAAAALMVVAAAAWLLRGPRAAELPDLVAADRSALVTGSARLAYPLTNPAQLEAALRQARPDIAARVFDFGMMGLALTGGDVRVLGRTDAVTFVYRDSTGRLVTCHMYVGRLEALPPASERRTVNQIDFAIYAVGPVTAVFWQEGHTVCVLTGEGDRDAVVALAAAKARRV